MRLDKKDVQLAVELVKKLKGRGYSRVRDVAKEINASDKVPFVEQIANKLKKGEVLEVKRGPGGGVRIKRNEQGEEKVISFMEIYSALGNKFSYEEPKFKEVFNPATQQNESQPVDQEPSAMESAFKQVEATLKQIKI